MRRILFSCEHYSPSVGGVQEVMRQIAERLAASGLSITVATGWHPDRPPDTLINGVRVVSFRISGNLVRGLRGPVEDYRSLLREGAYDALLIKAAQQWTFDAAIDILHTLSCRKLFIPCGFSGLGLPEYSDYFARMPRWLALFDALIFYSASYQDAAFARRHGLSNLHYIPNGADEREFSDKDSHEIREKLGIPAEHDLFLSVGSLIAAKGHWEVVKAFKAAHLDRAATLVINGNSPAPGRAERLKRTTKHLLAGRMPLPLEIRWRGLSRQAPTRRAIILDLPRPDLVDLYKASDIFLFASHVEYSPLVLFEAAAAGTPFIASSAGNSHEIAEWTGAGIIVPAVSACSAEVSTADFARALETLVKDRHRLSQMGHSGRMAIRNKGLTWADIANAYSKLLCA